MHAAASSEAEPEPEPKPKPEHADLGYNIWKLRWTSPFETQIKTAIPNFQHVDFWWFDLILAVLGIF